MRRGGELVSDDEYLGVVPVYHVQEPLMSTRNAVWAGIAGPLGFLAVSFAMAVFRPELISSDGWSSWPSSLATGGMAGVPQMVAFLWLAGCYVLFSLFALRRVIPSRAAWMGFLAVALGDLLLAFPTDGSAATGTSWHGALHACGVFIATSATLVAVAGVTAATRQDPGWKPWRWIGVPMASLAVIIGAAFGLDEGWAKLVYVLGVTLPVPLMAYLLLSRAPAPSPGRQA